MASDMFEQTMQPYIWLEYTKTLGNKEKKGYSGPWGMLAQPKGTEHAWLVRHEGYHYQHRHLTQKKHKIIWLVFSYTLTTLHDPVWGS